MFILYHFKRIPVSMTLAVVNIGIFALHLGFFSQELVNSDLMRIFLVSSSPSNDYISIWLDLGFTPYFFTPAGFDATKLLTPLTSMYTHAGIGHVLMNMLMLIFLGLPLEEKIGWKKFTAVYFGSGIGSALVVYIAALMVGMGGPINVVGQFLGQSLHTTGIGASGAIFGILGAYLILYPNDKVMFPLLIITQWPIKVIFLVYAGFETFAVLLGANDNIGHVAHLGGVLAGVLIARGIIWYSSMEKKGTEKSSTNRTGTYTVLAIDTSTREAYEHIRNEEDPTIKGIWIEELAKRAACPECHGELRARNGKIRCTKCRWSSARSNSHSPEKRTS